MSDENVVRFPARPRPRPVEDWPDPIDLGLREADAIIADAIRRIGIFTGGDDVRALEYLLGEALTKYREIAGDENASALAAWYVGAPGPEPEPAA